jgi:hypothetical protein
MGKVQLRDLLLNKIPVFVWRGGAAPNKNWDCTRINNKKPNSGGRAAVAARPPELGFSDRHFVASRL